MQTITASVLICAYNQEKYIGEALESILCQKTEFPFEIIVGDDASTDGTVKVVREYQECYPGVITLVTQERNKGATWNGYEISRRAKGKYVADCDGDDCWRDPTRLQRHIEFLEAHPEYSAVCGRCVVIDDNGSEIKTTLAKGRQFWEFDKKVYDWQDFEEWKMPGQIGAITARNVFDKYDISIFYKAHRMVGDRTSVLLYLLYGPIYCEGVVVSCYRESEGNHFMADYMKRNLRYEEVYLFNSLEKFAFENGKKIDLSKMKKNRLVAAVCSLMKNPSLDNLNVLWKIFKEVDFKVEFLYITLKTLILKLYYWNVLHSDKPISV